MARHRPHSALEARLEVWKQHGVWRWRYRDPRRGVVLTGNRSYPSLEAAVEAARAAYPGVPLETPGRQHPRRAGPLRATLAAAAIGAAAAGAALAVRRRVEQARRHP